jgi:hypothetical protein
MVVRLEIETWVFDKHSSKRGSGWGKRYGSCWILWSLCVFGCISTFVVQNAVSGIAGGCGCVQLLSRLVSRL